jgi:tetratricopeptide (TPR) repeat protein
VLALVAHAWGAPLGEAVAEDFDFLHRAMFSRDHTLLDGGGSTAFWRPVAHQLYYQALGDWILHHPAWVATLHVLMLAFSSLLLYRVFRRAWPGPSAALVATFPLFSESSRTLISWPSHFVDLGVWMFTAIALHETAARRLWSTLAALLAALLCKEVAVVAALLLPWIPGIGPAGRRQRLVWSAATGALAAAWAAVYLVVRHRAHLALPHHLETSEVVRSTPLSTRFGWAVWNSLRALFSLPAVATRWAPAILWTAAAILALASIVAVRRARQTRWGGRFLPLGLWGLMWFLAASATLVPIFPIWAPNRSGFGSLGFGVAVAALTAAAAPLLPAALVALRLAAFALSPGPVRSISDQVPDSGAFMDFERLVRLQLLMREMRLTLAARYPTLPHEGRVGQHYLPRLSEYALGGSKALEVWYRDSTLRWVRYADFSRHREIPLVTIVEFQSKRRPQLALVEPEAMREYLAGDADMSAARVAAALDHLGRADSLQQDRSAALFLGTITGERAVCLVALGRPEDAMQWASRGLELWPINIYANYARGWMAYSRGDLEEARVLLDSVLRVSPDYPAARSLRIQVVHDEAERNRLGERTGR